MSQPLNDGVICPECGVLAKEPWRDLCDECDADLRYRSCYCAHDERDGCICERDCPNSSICPGWEAELAEWWAEQARRLGPSAEAGQGRASEAP